MQAAALLPTSSADVKLLTATLQPDNRADSVLADTLQLSGRGGGCCLDCNRSMPDLAHALKRYQGQKSGGTEAVQELVSVERGKDLP